MPHCIRCREQYQFGDIRCGRCGAVLSDSPRSTPSTETPLVSHGPESNSLRFRRLSAGLTDVVAVLAATYYVYRLLLIKMVILSRFRAVGLIALALLIPTLYMVLRDSFGGKSLGKLLFGITAYVPAERRPGGFSHSLRRNACFSILAVPVFGWIAFGMMSATIMVQIGLRRRTRFGEHSAGTLVIVDADSEMGAL